MKNCTNKRIRVYFKGLGEGFSYERLFRALSLILSEEDLMKYLSNNQNNTLSSSLNECNEKSNVLVEKVATPEAMAKGELLHSSFH
jgi:hypothetical protein